MSDARQNIELKARIHDMDLAEETARRLTGETPAVLEQVDTYFVATTGRLKLREINADRAELIGYERADDSDAKQSNYYIAEVSDPASLKAMLQVNLGVRSIVSKRRLLYMFENVRIHLDFVEQLGSFLEFEAVLGPQDSEEAGREKVAYLKEQFRIAETDLISYSYVDLIEEKRKTAGN